VKRGNEGSWNPLEESRKEFKKKGRKVLRKTQTDPKQKKGSKADSTADTAIENNDIPRAILETGLGSTLGGGLVGEYVEKARIQVMGGCWENNVLGSLARGGKVILGQIAKSSGEGVAQDEALNK